MNDDREGRRGEESRVEEEEEEDEDEGIIFYCII